MEVAMARYTPGKTVTLDEMKTMSPWVRDTLVAAVHREQNELKQRIRNRRAVDTTGHENLETYIWARANDCLAPDTNRNAS
jgi:hypothetical protein